MKVLITFLLTSLAYHVMAVPAVNDDPKIDTSEMNAIPKDKKVSMHTSNGESRLSEGHFLSKYPRLELVENGKYIVQLVFELGAKLGAKLIAKLGVKLGAKLEAK